MSSSEQKCTSIGIVGAGLSGTLMALYLSQLPGVQIHLFEKRLDNVEEVVDASKSSVFGTSTSSVKRSINLAMSYRGIMALQGLQDPSVYGACMEEAIAMPCRVIHSANGKTVKQAYGQKDDAIWSVSRQKLNSVLLDKAKATENISIYFGCNLVSCDKSGACTFVDSHQKRMSFEGDSSFDLVIGADGAYSSVRDHILRQSRTNFSRQYIKHGYKELSIPPDAQGRFALSDHQGLHVWPRGDMMLIALPNADSSFTATLFAPYQGVDGFNQVDANDSQAVLGYFHRHFPDVVPYMPNLVEDFLSNPIGSLVTVRTDPWSLGRIVLIGDAAHAVVPFFGQGMNAAFEDCHMLYQSILAHPSHLEHAINSFAKERAVSTNTLADLCLQQYADMAHNTMSTVYLLTKKLQGLLYRWFPGSFLPLYSMVAFTNIPYHTAVERSIRQNRLISSLIKASFAVVGAVSFVAVAHRTKLIK